MEYSLLSASQINSLTRIWQKATNTCPGTLHTWEEDLRNIYDLEIGLQEMLGFLYSRQPGLDSFLEWANKNGSITETAAITEADVFTQTDLKHWHEHGYIVLREAVTKPEFTAANNAIWEFLDANEDAPESWYREHPAKSGLMVVFTQHPALRGIRNSARIRKAYEQLYGTTAIKKLIDKVSFNPPENEKYKFTGSPLHWDTSLELPIPERLQGLLYLTDTTAADGAFQCVPGFHRLINQWVKDVPADKDLRQYALETLNPVPVPGNAGDLVIWHQALPHCASPNLGNKPRLVQYLTYIPENYQDIRVWK